MRSRVEGMGADVERSGGQMTVTLVTRDATLDEYSAGDYREHVR